VVGGDDRGAEATAERFALGAAAKVVVAACAGRFWDELELAGSCLQLDSGQPTSSDCSASGA
jgi:hypothetical protein